MPLRPASPRDCPNAFNVNAKVRRKFLGCLRSAMAAVYLGREDGAHKTDRARSGRGGNDRGLPSCRRRSTPFERSWSARKDE
jgi:hypothetical protein